MRYFKILLAAGLLALLSACAYLEQARQRLGALALDFNLQTVDVSRFSYPTNTVEVARDLLAFDATARRKYGVDVRCRIRAKNTAAYAVTFDGARALLRVRETGDGAPAVSAALPAFSVGAGEETTFDVVFPLRLDQPVFSRATWTAILRGESIPYRIAADLAYRLPENPLGVPRDGSFKMDVVKGSVDVRQTGSTALEILLRAVEKAL
jgi:hypothetical protein